MLAYLLSAMIASAAPQPKHNCLDRLERAFQESVNESWRGEIGWCYPHKIDNVRHPALPPEAFKACVDGVTYAWQHPECFACQLSIGDPLPPASQDPQVRKFQAPPQL